jgi:hypothetical protein
VPAIFRNYLEAKNRAIVTDVNRWTGNQPANLGLVLSTKGTNRVARFFVIFSHQYLLKEITRKSRSDVELLKYLLAAIEAVAR